MKPPWSVFPNIPAGSMAWRMGMGEDYYNQFYRWFSNLSAIEQDNYALANPPPSGWANVYKNIASHPWL
jgi:hypothetical protein